MNIDQLRIVVEVADNGSVSKAARRLFLSQPNLSSAISSLEKEVGFTIFERSSQGMIPTKRGEELIKYAVSIISNADDILSLGSAPLEKSRFRLLSPSMRRVEEAFYRLCEEQQDAYRMDFSLLSSTADATIQAVYQNHADYGILICPQERKAEYEGQCSNRGLVLKERMAMPMQIIFGKAHPLNEGPLEFERMLEYPMIEYPSYADEEMIEDTAHHVLSLSEVSPVRKHIVVGTRQLRLSLTSRGVGFFVGTPLGEELMKQYDLASRDLPAGAVVLCTVVSERKRKDAVVQRFEKLLAEELAREMK